MIFTNPVTRDIVKAYDALKEITGADENGMPYTGQELQEITLPAFNALSHYLPDSHGDAEHIDGRQQIGVQRTPIDRPYEGQAHHMSKAAHSLVNMLNGLDYAQFSTPDAGDLTADIHALMNYIEAKMTGKPESYPVRREDGEVVNVVIPGREED